MNTWCSQSISGAVLLEDFTDLGLLKEVRALPERAMVR